MDVILLTSFNDNDSSNLGFYRNLGVYTIASNLRSHKFSVQVIDFNYIQKTTCTNNFYSTDQLFQKFQILLTPFLTKETLWIGISTSFLNTDYRNTPSADILNQFCSWVTSKAPKCKFVLGGHDTYGYNYPGWFHFHNHFDDEIIEFTKWCQNPKNSNWINPVNKRSSGNSNKTFTSRMHHWHPSDHIYPNESLPIEIARGCIFKCKFCSYNLNGKSKMDYIKDPGIIKEEIEENYSKFGTTLYTFADDTFNESVFKLKYLNDNCFKHLRHPIRITAFLRLDLIMAHPEMIDLLPQMGIEQTFFGIETLNHQNAKLVGKGMDPMKQIDFLHRLKEKWPGVMIHGSFILGLPYDTDKSINDTYDFLYSSSASPFDGFKINNLSLNGTIKYNKIKQNTNSPMSEFERNYSAYGYSFKDHTNDSNWYNSISNLCLNDLIEKKKYYQSKYEINKTKFTGFVPFLLHNIGVNYTDLKSLTRNQIRQKYDINLLQKNLHKDLLYRTLSNSQKYGG